jgi:integrase
MKLTTTIARNLEPPSGKVDHIEWDEGFPGFGVRLRAGRGGFSRMWIYQYDIVGRTRRITLGNVNAITIQDARKAAGALQGKVRLGRDPVMEKAESRDRAANTFASVMRTYLMMAKLRLRGSSWKAAEYHLRVFCKPLHPLPFTTITRRQIAAVLTPLGVRGKISLNNRVRSKLSALFSWAIGEGLTESNPVVGTTKYAEKARERVLSLPELAAIWHTLDDIHTMTDFSAQIRLLMLTGQRRGKIGDLRWREVGDDAIVLPGVRTKNGLQHTIPLSKPAQTILLARLRGHDDDFVFRRKNDGKVIASWHRRKASLNRALIKRDHTLAPWVLHDLRRSVATHMGEMGIQPHVIEAVLNHTSGFRGGMAGIYNRSKLEEPKRHALAAWAEVLMEHVEGREPTDKVVLWTERSILGR